MRTSNFYRAHRNLIWRALLGNSHGGNRLALEFPFSLINSVKPCMRNKHRPPMGTGRRQMNQDRSDAYASSIRSTRCGGGPLLRRARHDAVGACVASWFAIYCLGSYFEECIDLLKPRKPCLAEQSADPLPSMHEIHQSCPSRGRVQDPAELSLRGLRYSLRNRTRSAECHDRSRPGAARWRLGQTAIRARYARQPTRPQYYPRIARWPSGRISTSIASVLPFAS